MLFCSVRTSCYAQKGKKGESYVSSARAVHSFHTGQISAVSKRLLFARKLSIFETQHLSYLLLVLCMKHVLTRPSRAKGTTQQPRTNEGTWGVWLRSEIATLPPSDVQALYATIRDGVKKAWRTGLCGKVSKRGHLWNIMQGSCSMKALGCVQGASYSTSDGNWLARKSANWLTDRRGRPITEPIRRE